MMASIPAVPPDALHAERGFQADQRWHQFAFRILPASFGNRKLLDVGCGGGGVAAKASELGWEVTGIDIAPGNVEAMRRLGFQAEVVDLNGAFPFGGASFSCVTIIEVAEHLILAEHAFSRNFARPRPRWAVLFTSPNNASYRRRLKALKGRAPDDEGYHFRFWVQRAAGTQVGGGRPSHYGGIQLRIPSPRRHAHPP